MAKPAYTAAAIDQLLNDLPKLLISQQANRDAQILAVQSSFLSKELNMGYSERESLEAELESSTKEFERITGKTFSPEDTTENYQKIARTIKDGTLDIMYEKHDEIGRDIQDYESKLSQINNLLEGPLGTAKEFFSGAIANPAYSGAVDLFDEGDITAESFKAQFPEDYKKLSKAGLEGAIAKINTQTALSRLDAGSTLIKAKNQAIALESNQITLDAQRIASAGNAPEITALNKRIDNQVSNLNDIISPREAILGGLSALNVASVDYQAAYTADIESSRKGHTPKFYEAQAGYKEAQYQVGRLLMGGLGADSYEEAIQSSEAGAIQAESMANIGRRLYVAAASAIDPKNQATNAYVNELSNLYHSILKSNPDIDWASVESLTGWGKQEFEETLPIVEKAMISVQDNRRQVALMGLDSFNMVAPIEAESEASEVPATIIDSTLPDIPDESDIFSADNQDILGVTFTGGFEDRFKEGLDSELDISLKELMGYDSGIGDIDFSKQAILRDRSIEEQSKLSDMREEYTELKSAFDQHSEIYFSSKPGASETALLNSMSKSERADYSRMEELSVELGETFNLFKTAFGGIQSDKAARARKNYRWESLEKLKGWSTIGAMARTWAPSDYVNYRSFLSQRLGLKGDTPLHQVNVTELGEAIASMEGYYAPGDTVANRHNNPGNLKYAGQPGATKGLQAPDGGHYAHFNDIDAGWKALYAQIRLGQERSKDYFDIKGDN